MNKNDDLIRLIQDLNEAEVVGYLAFAKARTKRTDAQQIKLFNYFRKSSQNDLSTRLYGKKGDNAYYALKSRLQQSLVEYLAIQGFETDQRAEMETLRLLLAGRKLLQRECYSLARKTLKKAEKLAKDSEEFNLLHEVYLTMISAAHFMKINAGELKSAWEANRVLIAKNDRLALLFMDFKTNPDAQRLKTLRKLFSELEIEISSDLSVESLYEILDLYTDAASREGNYHFITAELEIVEKALISKHPSLLNTHYYYDSLFLLALSFSRITQFDRALHYLSLLQKSDKQFKSRVDEVIMLQALCNNYLGKAMEAIKNLEQAALDRLDAKCLLASFYLQQGQPEKALRQLNKLKHQDLYYERHYTVQLVVKKNLLLLLIYVDLKMENLVDSQLRKIQRKRTTLEKIGEKRILDFLKLILMFNYNRNISKTFMYKLDELTTSNFAEDVFAMSFYAWLKSKSENRPLYELTLELVQNLTQS